MSRQARRRARPASTPRPWSADEDDRLREACRVGLSSDFWSTVFPSRTFGDVAARRLDLNLTPARLI